MPQPSISALTQQFLAWVALAPRTYGDTMEAWRTSCPRMPVWEDAVSDGLVRVESGGAMKDAKVVLTARGRAALADAGDQIAPAAMFTISAKSATLNRNDTTPCAVTVRRIERDATPTSDTCDVMPITNEK
jgi:hypothetical protein